MELKPSRDKQGSRKPVKLDGMGRPIAPGDERNPFAQLAKGVDPRNPTAMKRRRWAADTLGATPPRDGPFSLGAADVAVTKPPRTRRRRNTDPQLPFPVKK